MSPRGKGGIVVSTYKAHIFKHRNVGEREEVKLKIFGPDGEELDLTGGGGGGAGPESEPLPNDLKRRMKSGLWYSTEAAAFQPGFQAFSDNTLWLLPLFVEKGVSLDRLGVNVSNQGEASSLIHMGLYSDVDGEPSELLIDGGSVAGNVSGFQRVTIDFLPEDYFLWFGVLFTNSSTTRPQVDGSGGSNGNVAGNDANPERAGRVGGYISGVTEFPESVGGVAVDMGVNSTTPRGFVRAV